MSCAFILNDDTILCHQTPDGRRPLTVSLPDSNNTADKNSTGKDSSDKDSSDKKSAQLPEYQIGRVALFESLAPDHWLPEHYSAIKTGVESIDITAVKDQKLQTTDSDDAQAATAISYDYALANNINVPLTETTGFVAYRQLITELPAALCDQLSQAMQLLRWQADTQFCSRCAAPVVLAAQNDRSMVCAVCNLRQYPRVQPCVITAITRPNPNTGEAQILLAHHHRYGKLKLPLQYGLIAGFVEVGESLEHAVVREVSEEVGITLKDIRYVSSQPWPYPSNLMLGFRAAYSGGDIVLQEEELSHADFFDLSNLPKIPAKGSIAHNLIAQIAHEEGFNL